MNWQVAEVAAFHGGVGGCAEGEAQDGHGELRLGARHHSDDCARAQSWSGCLRRLLNGVAKGRLLQEALDSATGFIVCKEKKQERSSSSGGSGGSGHSGHGGGSGGKDGSSSSSSSRSSSSSSRSTFR